jgi:hypothetical protein
LSFPQQIIILGKFDGDEAMDVDGSDGVGRKRSHNRGSKNRGYVRL